MTLTTKTRRYTTLAVCCLCAVVALFGLGAVTAGAQAEKAKKAEKAGTSKKGGKGKAGKAKKAAKTETAATGEKAEQNQPESRGVRFRFRDYPSLRFGRVLRVDFHLKYQSDFRRFSPEFPVEPGEPELFNLARTRVGIEGTFLRHFEYEVEREIREEVSRGNFDNPNHPWRDVYVNFRYLRKFQIKAGKYKLPFSMEQLTGPMKLDFVNRSILASELAPARDIGIMAHGRFFERGLSYEAGIFKGDGEQARATGIREGPNFTEVRFEVPSGLRTLAARVTGTPLRLLRVPPILQEVHLGFAFTNSTVPASAGREGLKGMRGRTISGETFFAHLFIHGQRWRAGTEMAFTTGPFSVKSEVVHVQEERRGQGIRGENLPDLVSRGWYLSGSWVITGEKKADGIEPKRAFIFGRGVGAWEMAARYEAIRFGSAEHPGRPSRGTRAANILPNSDRVWTFGMNWYLNKWMKFQFNAIRERLEDTVRTPIPGRTEFWMGIVRLQFSM